MEHFKDDLVGEISSKVIIIWLIMSNPDFTEGSGQDLNPKKPKSPLPISVTNLNDKKYQYFDVFMLCEPFFSYFFLFRWIHNSSKLFSHRISYQKVTWFWSRVNEHAVQVVQSLGVVLDNKFNLMAARNNNNNNKNNNQVIQGVTVTINQG